jgi:hypothetical protein
MQQIISSEAIQSTQAYQKASFIGRQFLIKRPNRELINNAIIVHRNTRVIPGNISGANLEVVKELIIQDDTEQHSLYNQEPTI